MPWEQAQVQFKGFHWAGRYLIIIIIILIIISSSFGVSVVDYGILVYVV